MTESEQTGLEVPHRLRTMVRKRLRDLCGPVWGERVFTFLQFWELVITGFINNRCPVRATALAYTTLLALIPMIAVAAGISTGILKSQGREPIDRAIHMLVGQVLGNDLSDGATNTTPASARAAPEDGTHSATNAPALTVEQKEKLKEFAQTIDTDKIATEISDAVSRIESGSLGVGGMVGLIVVAIMLFSTIEATFNDIWGVARGRSWVARIVQYWATVTLGPLIPVAVLSINISAQLESVQALLDDWGLDFLLELTIEKVLPIAILSVGFAFFYQLMPNTKVRWTAALIGGLTGGILWHLNSLLGVAVLSKGVTYSQIYGPLAVVPVFLVALYFSWLILLFGAQVAYAFQNRVAYLQEKEAQRINFLGREYLALRIMTFIGQRFDDVSGVAPSIFDIAQELRVSTRLVDDILKSMEAGKLVMETRGAENRLNETGYTLTRPLEKITCHDVLMTLRTARGETTEPVEDLARRAVDDVFEQMLQAEKSVSGATSLRDLLDRLGPGTGGEKPAAKLQPAVAG